VIRLEFRGDGDFEAVRAAEEWCAKLGISVGFMQGDAPRGLLWGDAAIAKWRNLTAAEQASCDGQMTTPGSSPRHGPVTVEIADPRLPAEMDPAAPRNVERREVLRQARIALAEEFNIPLSAGKGGI
jgi:hypothetical protein